MACEEFNFSESNNCSHVSVGKDFLYNVSVVDEDGATEDITGDVFELIIKDMIDGSVLLTLNNTLVLDTTGFYVNDAGTGDMDMRITATDTIIVGGGVFRYEWNRTSSSGFIKLEGYGTMQFSDRRI